MSKRRLKTGKSFYAFDYPMSQMDKNAYNKIFKRKEEENFEKTVKPEKELLKEEQSLSDLTKQFISTGNEILLKASKIESIEDNSSLIRIKDTIKQLESNILTNDDSCKQQFRKLSSNISKSSKKMTKISKNLSNLELKIDKNSLKASSELEVVSNQLKKVERTEQTLEKVLKRLEYVEIELENSNKLKKKKENSDKLKDIEDILLRFAAFGDERIEHIEIVGNGERTNDGTSVRKLIMESQLGNNEFEQFKLPKSWKTHSDSKTINLNFKQLTSMFNDVVLERMNGYEESVDKKVTHLEKKVEVIQKLIKSKNINSDQGNKLDSQPKKNHQPGASAGRAAYNRKLDKEKIKIH